MRGKLQYLTQDLPHGRAMVAKLGTVRSWCVLLFRAAQLAAGLHPLLAFTLKQINHVLTGADIAWQAKVAPGLQLFHPQGVVIGPKVEIGSNCRIQQGVTIGNREGLWPTVGNNVNLGAGSRIIGSIHVGDGAKIGANAVVLVDVPAGATAVGVPARIIEATQA